MNLFRVRQACDVSLALQDICGWVYKSIERNDKGSSTKLNVIDVE